MSISIGVYTYVRAYMCLRTHFYVCYDVYVHIRYMNVFVCVRTCLYVWCLYRCGYV
jgi:hypothetical protein